EVRGDGIAAAARGGAIATALRGCPDGRRGGAVPLLHFFLNVSHLSCSRHNICLSEYYDCMRPVIYLSTQIWQPRRWRSSNGCFKRWATRHACASWDCCSRARSASVIST